MAAAPTPDMGGGGGGGGGAGRGGGGPPLGGRRSRRSERANGGHAAAAPALSSVNEVGSPPVLGGGGGGGGGGGRQSIDRTSGVSSCDGGGSQAGDSGSGSQAGDMSRGTVELPAGTDLHVERPPARELGAGFERTTETRRSRTSMGINGGFGLLSRWLGEGQRDAGLTRLELRLKHNGGRITAGTWTQIRLFVWRSLVQTQRASLQVARDVCIVSAAGCVLGFLFEGTYEKADPP